MEAIASPIPKVAPKFFWLLKLLIYKPKKYFSANQRTVKKRILLQVFVEPDQNSMVD